MLHHTERSAWALGLGAVVVLLACGLATSFHVPLNDFWGLLFYAQEMRLGEARSLYSGLFPVGYAFLLGLLPPGSERIGAFVLSGLFAGLLVAAVSAVIGLMFGRGWALVAAVLAVTQPLVFRYGNTQGPDIGVAGLTTAAIWLIWRNELREGNRTADRWALLLAGACLGLSPLFRTHGLFSSLAVISCFWVFRRSKVTRDVAIVGAVFALLVSVQIAVNLVSGHGPFETAQRLNVYRVIHGIDWRNPPAAIDQSMLELILTDPATVGRQYLATLMGLVSYMWPAVLGFLFTDDPRPRRFALASAVTIILYAIPTALGDSPRAPLPILGLYVSSLVAVAAIVTDRLTPSGVHRTRVLTGAMILVLALALVGARWGSQNLAFLAANRAEFRELRRAEVVLGAHGMRSPTQVFADSFNFYLPSFNRRPLHNGGWPTFDLWRYREAYPRISVRSSDEFLQACSDNEIEFLVLTSQSRLLAPFLDRLYRLGRSDQMRSIVLVSGTSEKYRVFKLESPPS